MSPFPRRIGWALCCAMATCYWSDGKPDPVLLDPSSLSSAPIRRLTNAEYNNTVRDLLGDTTQPANAFPSDVPSDGLVDDARTQSTSPTQEGHYLEAAQLLARTANAKFDQWLACAAGETPRDCAQRFVKTFGRRAWRRPLSLDETLRLMTVYDAAPDATRGLERVIASLLLSPNFLYRPELDAATTTTTLGSYEIATRLSYFLWGTAPDDALLDVAQQGGLSNSEQVKKVARKMLADPRAHEGLRAIVNAWLGLNDFASHGAMGTDPPELTKTVRASMGQETSRFVDWVLWESDGRLATLLTAPQTFLDASLAPLYGLPAPTGAGLTPTQLDPTQRSGVLTQPSILWLNGSPAPILRGKFVRERLLCQPLPNPPPNVPPAPPFQPGQTTRQRFASHSTNPACKGCHSQMDPIGFGFESFDSIGRFRTMDQGQPVDASGELTGTDNDGKFVGVPDLAKRLAASDMVRMCVVKQFFRYAMGRYEMRVDAPSLSVAGAAFGNGDLRELVVAIAATDSFLGRRPNR